MARVLSDLDEGQEAFLSARRLPAAVVIIAVVAAMNVASVIVSLIQG